MLNGTENCMEGSLRKEQQLFTVTDRALIRLVHCVLLLKSMEYVASSYVVSVTL